MNISVTFDPALDFFLAARHKENALDHALIRDTLLLKRKKMVSARRIRSNLPYEQVQEVVDFFQCPQCLNIFWKGSHYDTMIETFTFLGLFSEKE